MMPLRLNVKTRVAPNYTGTLAGFAGLDVIGPFYRPST